MRRGLTVLLLLPLSLAACSGGDPDLTVRGGFGARADVVFPKGEKPGDDLAVRTLSGGKGARVGKGDLVIAHYAGYRWDDGGASKLIASSYAGGKPGGFPSGKLVPGLEKALAGKKVGSRVVAVIPPRDGYGAQGAAQLQITATDSLVYVLDVLATYPRSAAAQGRAQPLADPALPRVGDAAPGQAPSVTVPRARPPATLQVRTLVQGAGAPVEKGRLLAYQYTGVRWRDGSVFDSSWRNGQPYASVIGTGQVIRGLDQALVGQRVGSRTLVVVPPRWGYGAQGLGQAGIRGTDTLVFVVDVLGAH
ncbi:hypothetical protein DPM19_16995 [Actinomadura craniellae]|uniref:Peptidyl-prolyl cis-trans isomerase n=1 Tax=Actinomadura craniellae TaxID=2231787 RepID=A0A365H4E7_9ACTN|nr:FKBP-type peptidyl-prolyl cis-trans isomerase [Actinomadura craniellae]RAY13985.1 hypothetical protein DPM19_16995 [Actinomadura craniellae]